MKKVKIPRTDALAIYLIEVWHDVEPSLHGPYKTHAIRDRRAKQLRRKDPEGRNGLFWLDVGFNTRSIAIGCYSAGELGSEA